MSSTQDSDRPPVGMVVKAVFSLGSPAGGTFRQSESILIEFEDRFCYPAGSDVARTVILGPGYLEGHDSLHHPRQPDVALQALAASSPSTRNRQGTGRAIIQHAIMAGRIQRRKSDKEKRYLAARGSAGIMSTLLPHRIAHGATATFPPISRSLAPALRPLPLDKSHRPPPRSAICSPAQSSRSV
jgi:hypothetical protein